MTQPTNPTGSPGGPWHPKTWAANADTDEQTSTSTPPTYPPVEYHRLVEPAPITDPVLPVLNADGTFTVPLTPCCGAFPGDVCDCASFAASLAVAFRRPLGWRAA